MGARLFTVLFVVIGVLAGCGEDGRDATSTVPPQLEASKNPPAGVSFNEAAHICTYGSKGERAELGGYCHGFAHHPNRLIGVVGSNGETIVCADGKPLMVRRNESPPRDVGSTEPPEVVGGVESAEVTNAAVPRCGPSGGGPKGQAIWVPEDVGRDITEAPPRYVKAQAS